MKNYYEAPEAKAVLFVSRQELAFNFDELEDILNQKPELPGTATDVSKEDILVPLG